MPPFDLQAQQRRPTLALGATGDPVAQLQQQLLERGLLPVEAQDEVALRAFGAATAGAVATFQAKAGLQPDGIVGPITWSRLDAADVANDPPPPLDGAGSTPHGRAALIIAERLVRRGVAEEPPGTNRGPMVDQILVGLDGLGAALLRYQRDERAPGGWAGAPWCGRAAKYVVELGARDVLREGASPLAGWGDLASARKWREQAQLRRAWAAAPAPGRVGLILAANGHGHVVLVAGQVGGDGRFPTFEGNSGNRFAARRRTPDECTGGFVAI